MFNLLSNISKFSIPIVILFITSYGIFKKVKLYEAFTEGAKDGIKTAIRVVPHLTGMLVAIGIFRASGAMDYLCIMMSPLTNLINMPAEVLPMALMRPLSGGGAMGIMNSLFQKYGPDSLIGNITSIMAGSTDTTFYILAVYFGSINIKNSRHALPSGLLADAGGILAATFIANLLFS
ncbi:spore maturation protein [Sedimentibacter sp. zth1]|uniref:spore maturation protein n=1 Tax=Sedimentibacter sp. zth1 TaxID=2816908 RepID=UPI001A916A9B|nr:spore maturation protein [Sedimentibacter sp. zth1]QSX05214.1 spore maturation protein [Sedimentibacter sp. zth1]